MPETVYFAPPNYHLLIEADHSFTLSTDPKINFSRPSIDVLFETAAWTFKDKLIGILLTGSNNDDATLHVIIIQVEYLLFDVLFFNLFYIKLFYYLTEKERYLFIKKKEWNFMRLKTE